MDTLMIGHSPDADDAFMYYALAKEKVKIGGYQIDHVMEDIESLNHRARTGELPVTAISAAAYPDVADKYRIMSCGSSVGRNYGPLVLSKSPMTVADLAGGCRVAIPGEYTTAYMLLSLYAGRAADEAAGFEPVSVDFDRIMQAVQSGETDAGVIIHEGQITWQDSGLHKVLDLGEAWMEDTKLPIPLGLDVINRSLGDEKMQTIARALKDSIVYAREHEEEAIDYALQFGRGIDRDTCRDFVRMYVNDDTVDMGDEGRRALETLYGRAAERGLIPKVPPLDIIQA
ncbi:MAG: ABC transporter substrate-binding protein [Candidatus Krumholzibacteria bacterium]|nr:ABC transporter substrate-binding protein [Candidatus Krumholzibacteria bacterium]